METPISEVYNCDCIEFMRTVPDSFFHLAVVDPPYGLAKESTSGAGRLKGRALNHGHISSWDVAPTQEYFDELFRVSKHQIIWGGNYFWLPPTRCVICWDKVQPWENFSQIEIAWTSFDYLAKLFRYDNRTGGKIHPTQKPVELYAWTYKTFAQPHFRILDTHLGSSSSRIAAYKLGLNFWGCEIDPEYFKAAEERFKKECLGIETINGKTYTQQTLF